MLPNRPQMSIRLDGLTPSVGTRICFPQLAMQNDADISLDGFRFFKGEATTSEHEDKTGAPIDLLHFGLPCHLLAPLGVVRNILICLQAYYHL